MRVAALCEEQRSTAVTDAAADATLETNGPNP